MKIAYHRLILTLRMLNPAVSKDKSICSFPHWLNYHHDWRSIDDRSSLHVNRKAHSIKFREEGDDEETEAHITCHEATEVDSTKVRVIAHIKSKW